jgi:4-hydroxy-tetrahydrodipicolinate synthase
VNTSEILLVVPPLTPFNKDLSVDRKALKRQIDHVVETCNASHVVAAGVEAQEYHYLSFAARKKLIRDTIEMVDERRPVIVGISHPSFRIAIELADHATRNGAHALQLLAPLRPFGGEPSPDDLLKYFEWIEREIDLPLVLYLNPGPGADVSLDVTIALAKLEKVRYVKESSRNITRVGRLIQEIDAAGLARYLTTMQLLLPTLLLGGSGATMPPPAAALARLLIEAFVRHDLEEAARLQKQFSLFPARWMRHGLAPVMKAALGLLGVPVGDPYPPFAPVTGSALQALEAYLNTTDLVAERTQELSC